MLKFSLRSLLHIDAATCAVMALLLLVGSGLVSGLTSIPGDVLFYAGALLVPIALFMAVVGSQKPPVAWATNLIVLGNIGWVVASLALPLAGLFTPNVLGWVLLAGQAAIVALLAWLELRAAQPQAYA